MRKLTAAGTLVIACIASASSLLAHHSLANYDTDTPIHLKGVVVRIERVNPHSLIFIDHQDGKGSTVRWALEGPGPVQTARMGLDKIRLEVGDVIEACGYATKERIDRTANAAPSSGEQKATTSMPVTGRAFNAEMLVFADGSKRAWSDYGQHHCLGKDYKDIHTRLPWGTN
jgi:hypothetical protein